MYIKYIYVYDLLGADGGDAVEVQHLLLHNIHIRIHVHIHIRITTCWALMETIRWYSNICCLSCCPKFEIALSV